MLTNGLRTGNNAAFGQTLNYPAMPYRSIQAEASSDPGDTRGQIKGKASTPPRSRGRERS